MHKLHNPRCGSRIMRLQVDLEHGSLVIAAVGAPRAALAKPAAAAKGTTNTALHEGEHDVSGYCTAASENFWS